MAIDAADRDIVVSVALTTFVGSRETPLC